MIWLAVLAFACAGGWFSRMAGGGPPKLPWGLDQWLYALPYLIISLPALAVIACFLNKAAQVGKATTRGDISRRSGFTRLRLLILTSLPYFGAFIGKRTGHGGGIDAGTNEKEPGSGREPEKLEYLILPLHSKMPRYWYDILLLSITGLAVTLIAGIMLLFISIPYGLLVLLSGVMKGPAYMIGWRIYPKGHGRGIPHLNEATAIGEFLTGWFGWGALGIIGVALGIVGI